MARGRRGDNRRRSGVVSEMTKEEADLFVPAPPSLLSLNFSKPEPLLLSISQNQSLFFSYTKSCFLTPQKCFLVYDKNYVFALLNKKKKKILKTEKKQFHCDDWNLQEEGVPMSHPD